MSFAFHACAPPGEWINDPNGLLRCDDGRWTLFVQHSAVPPEFKAIGWARLTSDDLLHWRWEGQVIGPRADGHAWSGSVRAGERLTALLTRCDPSGGVQRQIETSSDDGGRSWRADTALGGATGPNIRDPFHYRLGDGSDVILLAEPCPWTAWEAAPPSRLSIWRRVGDALTRIGTIGPWSPAGVMWEMPVLIDLDDVQVLIVSMVDRRGGGATCSVRYWIGHFEGRSFAPAIEGEGMLLDQGPDFYAAIIDSGPAPDRLLIAWASTWATARSMPWPGGSHGGPISLPRRLTLSSDKQRLVQRPLAAAPLHVEHRWEPGAESALRFEGADAALLLAIGAGGHLRVERQADDARLRWSGSMVLPTAQIVSIYRDRGLFELFFEPLGASLTVFLPGG